MAFDEYRAAMFGRTWKASERKYRVHVEQDVPIPLSDGVRLSCNVFRPEDGGRFPAILGFHCYHQAAQTGPMKPVAISSTQWKHPGQERTNASLESGDPNFFVRRGYVHVVCNSRGTGKSEGLWSCHNMKEAQDAYQVIEWIARQPWCDGNVAMFGVSYFSIIQFLVASLNPPHLKCLFAPWGLTDWYRDLAYRGGIFSYGFPFGWAATSLVYSNCRPENYSKKEMGEEGYRKAIARALEDEDIRAVPELVGALRNPETGINPFIVDIILHPHFDAFWQDRAAALRYDKIKIPAYLGACWGSYGIHTPAAFRSWEALDVPKKMVIGPPIYLDRPLYQLQHEAVRWFDHWLKGVDTGIMEEPPVRCFVMGTGEWKASEDWPLPQTKWTPFYLHERGLLFEHEHWPNEGCDSFEDSPWMRESLTYATPPLVENTEVVGPVLLKFHASTTDVDVHWIISLLEIDAQGKERLLTKGWLRGSHRALDMARSKPYEAVHKHDKSEPLTPGEIYEYDISLCPTGNLFRAGTRIAVRISCVDDKPTNPLELIAAGSLRRTGVSRITVFRNEDYPSYLLLPITRGNVLQTFLSGGVFPQA